MVRLALLACLSAALSCASLTPAFAIIHNSPALTKNSGPMCGPGMYMKSTGHGATRMNECVKKGS